MHQPAQGSTSLWHDQLEGPVGERQPLAGDADVDVAIIGAGYSGLWSAHALLRADPTLRVLVIEREAVGFGASGRNGGWCVGELAGGLGGAVGTWGREAGIAMTQAIIDTVAEIGRVVTTEGIDCGFVQGGVIRLARSGPQLGRQRTEVDEYRHHGFGVDVLRPLDADEAIGHLAGTNVLGGLHYAPGARVQPARLVGGLAEVVERLGATIVEHTSAVDVVAGSPGARPLVVTDRGLVRADVVVRATEAYSRDLPGLRRALVPLYSLMIATEPLDAATWESIGLRRCETFADDRRMVIYGQRTTDDRVAFGGRGAPYRFGSAIDPATESRSDVHDRIGAALVELLPQLGGVEITHRWGGVLGVPRDWRPSVGLDRSTGIAWTGGYVGEGVAAANLAGRTIADLVLHPESPLVA
ncbi:MAG TPA: FAD-binding oxidoreductase, partial [Ilumatobacteraceae bacterium]|nr:FAD-binding oxidoreductase [Ilumatobacteraceae bacterium]